MAIDRVASDGGPWPIVLIGDAGTGKTCAALCVLDYVYGSRRYFTVQELCDELIAVQNGQREYAQAPDTISHWWRRWREARCVVVDELAARERVSDFQYETVKRAIDERRARPMVCISNSTLGHIAKVYDDRIASRLAGGTVIEFVGDDRRLKSEANA